MKMQSHAILSFCFPFSRQTYTKSWLQSVHGPSARNKTHVVMRLWKNNSTTKQCNEAEFLLLLRSGFSFQLWAWPEVFYFSCTTGIFYFLAISYTRCCKMTLRQVRSWIVSHTIRANKTNLWSDAQSKLQSYDVIFLSVGPNKNARNDKWDLIQGTRDAPWHHDGTS